MAGLSAGYIKDIISTCSNVIICFYAQRKANKEVLVSKSLTLSPPENNFLIKSTNQKGVMAF